MNHHSNEQFFSLLRYALGAASSFDACPTEAEWRYIYEQGVRQSVIALLFTAVNRLRDEQEPPLELTMKWATEAEVIAGLNDLQNRKAARLTELFEQQGHHTAILKGQANARLYPDPLSRQPGDIDIYVDGGRERVEATLRRLGMAEDPDSHSEHHFHLIPDADGIEVEVHFKPSSGNLNPKTNRRLQAYLMQQLDDGTALCDAGFRVPSTAFALTMQLSHICRHVMEWGLGLRQIVDYYFLLRTSTDDDRRQLAARLKELGLRPAAAALMWVLAETLHLPKELMVTAPDRWRGRWLLGRLLDGGNFGWYGTRMPSHGAWRRFAFGRRQTFVLIWFCPKEAQKIKREELQYWRTLFVTIPLRIKQRKLSISVPKK